MGRKFVFMIYPRTLLLVLLAICVLFACAPVKIKKQEVIYWPKPPDPPRYVYETSLRSSQSISRRTATDSIRDFVTGQSKAKEGLKSFAKAFDVAAHGGKIVVTDTVARAAVMFDVPRRKVFVFGVRGDGKGKGILQKPLGVGMDAEQFVYIADVSAQDVKVYDPLGLYIRSIGGKDFFERPVDVAANNAGDRIYVLDAGGIQSEWHRVIVFDKEGNKINEIGRRGVADGEFNLPNQLTVANDGTLYVLDAGNFRVQAFTADGEFITKWGKVGRNLGDFARPRGIATDSDGNVYVTDTAFRNFQIFNPDGKLLLFIGGPGLEDKPGQYVLPSGVAVDETDRLYIVDQMHHKVEVIRRLSKQEIENLTPNTANAKPADEQTPAP